MSTVLDQKVSFYDHVLGLEDSITAASGSNSYAKKGLNTNSGGTGIGGPIGGMGGSQSGSAGSQNIQKRIYRYSPAIARASFSGPVPANGFDSLLAAAVNGTDVDANMTFWSQQALNATVKKAKVSTLSISIKAGEVAQFSAELVGAEYGTSSSANSSAADCQKLCTWDVCTVTATGITSDISSFDITISNPTIPIYTAKWTTDSYTNGMMPQKIRLGIQEVTGTLGIYGPTSSPANRAGTIDFKLNGGGKTLHVIFNTPTDTGSGGPYIRSLSFVGANDQSIWA
jgi:hypothetical protein